MKILITTDNLGGVWTFAMNLAAGLKKNDHDVFIAITGNKLNDYQLEELVPFSWDLLECRQEWMHDPWDDIEKSGEWLIDLSRKFQPDVVHLNSYSTGSLNWEVPVVITAHSCVYSWWEAVRNEQPSPEWSSYMEHVMKGLSCADAVVAPSEYMMSYILKYYGPVRGETVIHNGADPAKYYVSRKEDFVFSMGRLWDEAKNIRLVIEAAGHIKYPVYIAGSFEGREMPEMPANVRMLGYLPPDAIKEWLSRAAIYLLPVKYEPFGYTFLEAALSGCAIITGKIGSMREIWEESAVFADTGDSFSLAMLVNGLMADPEHRQLMTLRARERAASMYTATTMAENYAGLYRRTISSYATRNKLKLQEQ